ncbi:FtsX-like permease family protein [Solicola sp. PLA-1-18]|uniref:FtsX-like permease family protein n=1 Tax=Solicola sp. PLA-1-18 TaxID=3380532 RepID=UPI003B771850
MRTVVLSSLRHQLRRYVAAGLAIAIAVAFVVAVNAMSAAARDGATAEVAAQYRGAGVVVTGDVADASAARATASGVPGVDATAVNRTSWTEVGLGGVPSTRGVGTVAADDGLRWQQLASGAFPRGPTDAVVSADAARDAGIAVGDRVTAQGIGGGRFTVTGLVDDASGPLSATLYAPEDVLAGSDRAYADSLVVRTADGDAGSVATALRSELGGGATVQEADDFLADQRSRATQGVDVFQNLVLAFAALAAFVGVLVIANTFTILLAQRARDFALLRCVGSLRRQLVRGVVAEAAVLALVASLLGAVAGYALAFGGVALLDAASPLSTGTPTIGLASVAVPVLVAVLVTVAASVVPARRVARRTPLAALQPQVEPATRSRAGALRIVTAVAVGGAGAAALLLGAAGPSLPVAMAGGMLSFVGVVLLGPVLVPGLVRLLGPLVRAAGVPGRLAVQNAVRNPRRTASTTVALLVGVTLVTTVVVGTASVKSSVGAVLDDAAPVDLALTSTSGALPGGLTRQVDRTDGVGSTATLPGAQVDVGDISTRLIGVGDDARAVAHGGSLLGGLRSGTVVLPSQVASDAGVVDGARVQVVGADGRRVPLTVAVDDGVGAVGWVTARDLRTLAGADTAPSAIWLRAAGDADARATTSAVGALASGGDLDVSGGLPQRAEVLGVLDTMLQVTVGLLAVSVLIALVGVGNTMSLSVLERLRETSLLRALGLERRRLRRTIGLESLLMSVVATVLGVGLGVLYAWCGVRAVSAGVLGGVTLPWAQLLGIVAVAALAGLVASVLPARRAARVSPAAGLVAD